MKANQLATLVLRLMGIFCLVQVIPQFPLIGSYIFNGTSDKFIDNTFIWIFTSLVASIIVGVLLIVSAEPLGKKLIPKDATSENLSPVSFMQVQMLAFAVTGVLIFASALPQLLTSIYTLLRAMSSDNSITYPYDIGRRQIESSIGTFLKAGLGLWLFFGANGFANFWSSMRNFGAPRPPQTP
jgi:hypothetical protein